MSDTDSFDPEDYEGIAEKTANIPRRQVRLWEKQAKELAEKTALLEQLQKERSFVHAGIPETPLGKLFMRGYDGPNDTEAIKTAAAEYGIIEGQTGQSQIDASLNGHDAARAAASGAATPDPRVDLDSRMRAAKSAQELAQILEEAGVKPTDLKDFPALRS